MKLSVFDPFIHYRRSAEGLNGAIILQVYNYYGFVTEVFPDLEEHSANNIKQKPYLHFIEDPVRFNGVQMRKLNSSMIVAGQYEKIDKLEVPNGEK